MINSSGSSLRIALVDDSPHCGHGLLFTHLIRDRALSHGVELVGYYSRDADAGEAWCRKHQIPWVAEVIDFQGKADAVIIPAATTPESHHALFEAVIPLGLPTYIDKPLASTRTEGELLYALADLHEIPLMSASALRFSQEVRNLKGKYPSPSYLEIWAGWREKFDEFFIHAAELFTSLSDTEIVDITRHDIGQDIVRYECSDARGVIGAIHLCTGDHGFSMLISNGVTWHFETIKSSFFVPMIEAVITFLRQGQPSVSAAEALHSLELIDRCRGLEGALLNPVSA